MEAEPEMVVLVSIGTSLCSRSLERHHYCAVGDVFIVCMVSWAGHAT